MINRWLDHFRRSSPRTKLVYLLAASLPFEHLPTVEIGGWNIRISALLGIALIIYSLPDMKRLVKAKKYTLLELVLAAWAVWMAIGLLFGSSLHDGLVAYLPLLFLVVMSIAIRLSLPAAAISQVVNWIMGGAVLAIIFGVYQFFGNLAGLSQNFTGLRVEYTWQRLGFPRMQSVALEPLYFSAYLLLPFSLLSTLVLRLSKKRFWLVVGLLLIVVAADALTVSRGGLAAAVLALVIVAVWYRELWRQLIKVIAVIALAGLAAIAVIALSGRQGLDPKLTYGTKGVGTLTSHLSDFRFSPNNVNSTKNDSINQRSVARDQAKQIMKDHPAVLLFGTGIGQYHSYASTQYTAPDQGEPNNVILEQIVQTGLVGFGLLVLAFGMILAGLYKVARTGDSYIKALAVGLIAFIIAIGFQAQTFSGLLITPLWFVVGLSLFLIQSAQQTKHKQIAHVSSKISKNRARPLR